jgi:hypothetical protein
MNSMICWKRLRCKGFFSSNEVTIPPGVTSLETLARLAS